jgi:hypothetical protein
LLWAWSTLEAITQKLGPELAVRQLPDSSTVDVIVSNALVSQFDGKGLWELGRKRNMLAHSQVDYGPAAGDVSFLLGSKARLSR